MIPDGEPADDGPWTFEVYRHPRRYQLKEYLSGQYVGSLSYWFCDGGTKDSALASLTGRISETLAGSVWHMSPIRKKENA